ncbi:hypothetical protein B0O80DRAFT_427578 [Mortierella sp. GBAus27b]|nr:hypothetical protein B0O80DRAFT_427578 [Mortierella sp. GBAus27b]
MGQHHHALNLPEVLFRIGQHLDTLDDVVACLLVCKSFRASFEPYIWANIHLGFSSYTIAIIRLQEPLARYVSLRSCYSYKKEKLPSQDRIVQGLQRIAPWIRSLNVHCHIFPGQLRLGDRCTGIRTLLIDGIPLSDRLDETYWSDCEALLAQNSASLRSLTLAKWGQRYGHHKPDQPLWKVFMACSKHANLTTLRIITGRMSERDLEALWGACKQLEILELTNLNMEDITTWLGTSTAAEAMSHSQDNPNWADHHLTIEEQVSTSAPHALSQASMNWSIPTIATTPRFPKLRELTLNQLSMSSGHQLELFILHCPMLQILIWKTRYTQSVMERFCDYLAAQTWPCIDWIEIKREHRFVTDQEHNLLLQSAPRPLRRLDVNIGTLEQSTFNLYRERCHFETLTKVDLTQSTFPFLPLSSGPPIITLVSKQVQEVLESCPLLEHIAAVIINVQDIVQGKPWVCHRLQKFEVMINMELSRNNHDQEGMRARIEYTEDHKRQCHQIFERLSQLSQLTMLDMRLHGKRQNRLSDIKSTSLPLRLRMGLGHLSTLRKLEMVGYHGAQEIRVADMEWMLQHWNKLQSLQGTGGGLSVKWSRASEGAAVGRLQLVMETLKARRVQLSPGVLETSGVLGTIDDSESENEGASEANVKQ